MKKLKKKKRKQPNLLLRLTCNNCDAIISENKEKLKDGRVRPTYSFGLMACCGSTPNSAFSLSVLNADKDTHLTLNKSNFGDTYHFVNPPDGMYRNGRLLESAINYRLTYETIYNTGRAELYVDHRRVGVVWLSHDDGEPYFHLEGVRVYLKDIDKEDDFLSGGWVR